MLGNQRSDTLLCGSWLALYPADILPTLADSTQITLWLRQWRGGDKAALNQLMPAVYQELKRVAAKHFQSERPDHTLQPTALLHETYLRMVDQEMPDFRSRAHFFCVASQ